MERDDCETPVERAVEPFEPRRVQPAPVLAGTRRVEHDEAQRTEVDRVLDRPVARDVEGGAELRAVIVVARQGVDRHTDLLQQLARQPVFACVRVVGDVARDHHCVGRVRAHGLDDRLEPIGRIGVRPGGAYVRIAQLSEQERPGHGRILSAAARWPTV